MQYRCHRCDEEFDKLDDAVQHVSDLHNGDDWIEIKSEDGVWRFIDQPAQRAVQPEHGTKDDSDKIRLELIPPELLFGVGEILSFGARKYADRNWEQGLAWSRVFGAMMRHMWCWWGGAQPTGKSFVFGDLDMETGKSHLWHAGCCLAFLIAYEERGTGTDDRPRT